MHRLASLTKGASNLLRVEKLRSTVPITIRNHALRNIPDAINPLGEFKEDNVSLYHEDESDDTGLIDWGSMNITVLDHVRLRELANVCFGNTKWLGFSASLSGSKIAHTRCHSNEVMRVALWN